MTTARHSRMLLALPAALIVAVLVGTPAGAATRSPATGASVKPAAAAKTQGLIMKEGNICDPFRHMGC